MQQLIIARELLKEVKDMNPESVLPQAGRAQGLRQWRRGQGRMLFIAGMIGWDADGVFHTDDFGGQARQALQNVADVLQEAGGTGEHIVRMTWYVTDKREYLAARARWGRPSARSSATTTSR